ncbi:MAG: hypothetical protein FGM32_00485 [Candidatus Kapabacteria bacterium]|nr:hypothetical protein [Candidatus Kapabacteria bacterium]
MGNDQGDVPLSTARSLPHGDECSRIGLFLFAFLFFAHTLAAQDVVPDRCGAGDRSGADRIRRIKQGTITGGRPILALSVESVDGRFRVHYDTSGPHAVDLRDSDGNDIPDYIDECLAALEHAWKVEIDTLGYLPPPADGIDGGSPALDVYVEDLGPMGFYGIATPERMIRQSPTELWVSFLEIDNDYSPLDTIPSGRKSYTTTGLDALRITCAHEFHHAVQNGSYAFLPQHRMLYEMTSTWMELRCWPEVRDWAFYASALLTRPSSWPLSRSTGNNGYVWGWFGNVLASLPGNVLRSTWERIGQARMPYAALVDACSASGTTIDDAFCVAVESLYRTGSRGTSNAILPGAQDLPEIAVSSTLEVTGNRSVFSGSMAPFEVRSFRFNLTNPAGDRANADVILSLSDGRVLANDTLRDRQQSYAMTLSSNPSTSDVPIASTGWGVGLTPDAHCIAVEGIALLETASPFPQPLDLSSPVLYVPVAGGSVGDSVSVSILDLSMRPAQPTMMATISVVERRVVATMTVDRTITPGTYLLFVDDRRSTPSMRKIYIR